MTEVERRDAQEEATSTTTNRLTALDAFRGLVLLLMVIVNDGSGPRSYPQLEHSAWHGWTLTDTVFPSFLWIVGIAITLSLGKRLQLGMQPTQLIPSILKRSAILFAVGMFLYLFPHFDWGHARILGVLQRIAICYLIVSLIYLYCGIRGQLIWIGCLLALYWALMSWYPVPGHGAGGLDVENNFAHYIDSLVLGAHNYRSTKTWDPEGIVSTLPAIVTTLFGVMAGHVLRLRSSLVKRTGWMFFIGCLMVLLGLFWSALLPINKKLWTDSFAVFMAGLDFLALGCFLWFVDELGFRKAVKPLVIVGMNSIAVYVSSELLAEILDAVTMGGNSIASSAFTSGFASHLSPENASLFWALSYTAIIYLFAYLLYRRRWFWRV